MRWVVVLLVIANLGLYFWLQHQAKPSSGSMTPPAPDVGRLRLLREPSEATRTDASQPAPEPQVVSEPPTSNGVDGTPDLPAGVPVAAESHEATAASVDVATDDSLATDTVSGSAGVPIAAPASNVAATSADVVEPVVEPDSPPLPVTTDALQEGSAAQTTGEAVAPDLESQVVAVSEPAPVCARVGPFEPGDADTLIANLPAHLVLISDVSEEFPEVDGYYVMIPAAADRAAGLQKLSELKAAGLKDVWLFRAGEFENAISLGLFSRETSARRHAERARKLGFSPEVRNRTSPKERRWLQLESVQGGAVTNGLPLPEGVGAQPAPCP